MALSKPKNLKSSLFIINLGDFRLVEPFTQQSFPSQEQVETPEITPWLQAQIDCGLFQVIGEVPAAE